MVGYLLFAGYPMGWPPGFRGAAVLPLDLQRIKNPPPRRDQVLAPLGRGIEQPALDGGQFTIQGSAAVHRCSNLPAGAEASCRVTYTARSASLISRHAPPSLI